MTTEITKPSNRTVLTPDEATHIQGSWRGLLDRSINGPSEIAQIKTDVGRMKAPATMEWIAGRVMAVLSHYYVSSLPEHVMESVIDDWVEILHGLPEWAIQKSCLWWMGNENPQRRSRPLPGDIEARAKWEMGAIRVAEIAVELHLEGKPPLRLVSERDNG